MIYHVDCESRELDAWFRTLCYYRLPVVSATPIAFSVPTITSVVTPSEAIAWRVFFNAYAVDIEGKIPKGTPCDDKSIPKIIETIDDPEYRKSIGDSKPYCYTQTIFYHPAIRHRIMEILNERFILEKNKDID